MKRQQRALGQQLHDQPAAPGAERQADGDLLLPRRRARQQQVRDVGARDQQHQADDRHQQAAGLDDVVAEAGVDRRLRQRHQRDAAALVLVRVFLFELARDRLQVGFGLLHRDARLQPAGHVEHEPAPVVRLGQLAEEAVRRLRVGHVRHPQRRRADRVGALEALRHHADDREGVAVQVDRAADDRRVAAVPLLPLAVPEHRHQLRRPASGLRRRRKPRPICGRAPSTEK